MAKKLTAKLHDHMRKDYKRSDFGVMERGKYVHLARRALEDKNAANTNTTKASESSRDEKDS